MMRRVVRWITWQEGDALVDAGSQNVAEMEVILAKPYIDGLSMEIVGKNLCIYGRGHQSDRKNGVPVFDDGSVYVSTIRGWAAAMAEIWESAYRRGYTYVDFVRPWGK